MIVKIRFLLSVFYGVIFVLLLAGCNPKITRIGYTDNLSSALSMVEIPVVQDDSTSLFEGYILGSVKIGDSGFSKNCDAISVAHILQVEASKLGANLIQITKLNKPDMWSTCYRVNANFIGIDTTETVYQYAIFKGLYKLQDESKYFEGKLLDTLDIPKPKMKLGIGFEAIQPSAAVNSYMYLKNLLFRYSYGFSNSSIHPNTLITDVKNAHHVKIGLEIGSLFSKISYAPIYAGIGKSYVNEKPVVQGYEGKGKINGTHYFIGVYFLSSRQKFFKHFGSFLEIGKSKWDYKNSVLIKNNTDLKYGYLNFYYSIGLVYYLF